MSNSTKQERIYNAEYVAGMDSAVDTAKERELAAAALRKQQQLEDGISNDQLELLEREEAHYIGRAQWIAKFKTVTAAEFDKLKKLGVQEQVIEYVSRDKYAVTKCAETFKLLAHKDMEYLKDEPLKAYLSALMVANTEDAEYVSNDFMLKSVGLATNRQHDMCRNMFSRLGVIVRCKDEREFSPIEVAKGCNQIKLNKTNKIFKMLEKIYE